MGRINLDITETEAELKQLLSKETSAKAKERVHALYLVKSGFVSDFEALAQLLGRDIATLYRWFQKYRASGLAGLLQPKQNTGRKPAIPPVAEAQLRLRLQDPEAFSSYGEIQAWLRREFGVEADYKVVQKTVRKKLKTRLVGSTHPTAR